MLIKGEKYACDACVRGHRVSSCQHQDRPLVHINKKGRPVSQCSHCRGLRKARAQHVKCDCAEKAHTKEDCPHDKGEKGDHSTCCCGHGSRCICALKKDYLDTVLEDTPQPILPAVAPREHYHNRLSSLNSHESKLTIFTNGHHKPVHKINDMHNMCGAPYKIPARSHTVHGHREIAQRSSDSLPLTKAALMSHETPQHHESVTSAPQPVRRVKSEHGSPELNPQASPPKDQGNPIVIPPLDPNAYSYSPFASGSPLLPQPNQQEHRLSDPFHENYFVTYEMASEWEPPLHSAGLSETPSEVDWSQFNFGYGGSNMYKANNAGPVPSQPPSYASLDHFSRLSHPGLTSSSGEISEVEDCVPVKNPGKLHAGSQDAFGDFSSVGADEAASDVDPSYRLSSASSYIGIPQANGLSTIETTRASLDIDDYLKQAVAQTRQMQLESQRPQFQPTTPPKIKAEPESATSPFSNHSGGPPAMAGSEHPFTVQEAQNYAHMDGESGPSTSISPGSAQQHGPRLSITNYSEDPMLSYEPDTPDDLIDVDGRDEGWVR